MNKLLIASLCLLSSTAFCQDTPPGGPPKPPPIPMRWTHDSTRIAGAIPLTAKQVPALRAAFFNFYKSMDALMKESHTPPPRETVDKLIATRNAAVQKALTPAQYTTFTSLKLMPPPRGQKPPGDRRNGKPPTSNL